MEWQRPLAALVIGAAGAVAWLGCNQMIGLSDPRIAEAEGGHHAGSNQDDAEPEASEGGDEKTGDDTSAGSEPGVEASTEAGSDARPRDATVGDEMDVGPPDTSCVPVTCQQLGYDCGQTGDRCGGVISCGTCAPPDSCSSNRCWPPMCGGIGSPCTNNADCCGNDCVSGTCTSDGPGG
jgi:hypothetical protein